MRNYSPLWKSRNDSSGRLKTYGKTKKFGKIKSGIELRYSWKTQRFECKGNKRNWKEKKEKESKNSRKNERE